MKQHMDGGFALIELVVVVAIIAGFSALAVPSWRGSAGTLALDRAAAKISQDMRRATELSMRAQWFSCASGRISGYGLSFFVFGSGLYSYTLFADCNNNQKYDAKIDGVVEQIRLEKEVRVSDVFPPLGFSIVAIPPEPVFFIKGRFFGISSSNARITLSLINNPSKTKVVRINEKGVVTID